ncbi:hypothetical protein DTL42_12670 [Bremerella cremea]|uniref:Uncharacterized protein n=1 Tax=Bremerella cremea TaxID=1031537 RepID=A0A368KUS8_9BACT|nr:hypothetical protein [Bremerella cremea]RCS49377.1 hypothetical protein DTL42_12670 [Bremerella cremea]
MSRERITIGGCPKCKSDLLTCQHNHFQNDELEIHSWEHKCPDCGFRQTEAFRSDDEDEPFDPILASKCPFCGRPAND